MKYIDISERIGMCEISPHFFFHGSIENFDNTSFHLAICYYEFDIMVFHIFCERFICEFGACVWLDSCRLYLSSDSSNISIQAFNTDFLICLASFSQIWRTHLLLWEYILYCHYTLLCSSYHTGPSAIIRRYKIVMFYFSLSFSWWVYTVYMVSYHIATRGPDSWLPNWCFSFELRDTEE